MVDSGHGRCFRRLTLAEAKFQGTNVPGVQGEVKQMLQAFYAIGYVHGDVRDINLLVRRPGRLPGTPILLVDWDWAGLSDEVTYPYTLSPDLVRAERAVTSACIEASHEEEMVRWLLDV